MMNCLLNSSNEIINKEEEKQEREEKVVQQSMDEVSTLKNENVPIVEYIVNFEPKCTLPLDLTIETEEEILKENPGLTSKDFYPILNIDSKGQATDSYFPKLRGQKIDKNEKTFFIKNKKIDKSQMVDEKGNISISKCRTLVREIGWEHGVTCFPTFRNANYSSKNQKFYGFAICKHKEHRNIKFNFHITNCETDPTLSATCTGDYKFEHSGIVYTQLRGEARELVKLQLKNQKPDKFLLDSMSEVNMELLNKGIVRNSYGLNTLQKANSEQKSAKKLVKECDLHGAIECKMKFPSYVQKVSTPLEVHLYSEDQTNVLRHLIMSKQVVVLHFDATGSMVRDLNCHDHGEKTVLYYAAVISVNGKIFPLAELISAKHDANTITQFLKNYKQFVHDSKINGPIFQVVVTDFSWALIKSVLDGFNKLNVLDYLNVTFDFLDKGTDISQYSILFICCAHFIKLITNQIKAKVSPQNKSNDLKQFIKKSFAVMVDSTSFDELKEIFISFVYVLESPTLTESVKKHVDTVTNKTFQSNDVKEAFMAQTKHEEERDVENALKDNFFDTVEELPTSSKLPIYRRSKFYEIFNKIVEDQKETILVESVSNSTKNPLYVENFVEFVTRKYMPYAPFWTAIITGKRFSNSIGELFFRIMKHIYFPERKMEVSTFIQQQHQNIQNLVIRTEYNDVIASRKKRPLKVNEKTRTTKKRKLELPSPDNDTDSPDNERCEETWKDRHKKKSLTTSFNNKLLINFKKDEKFPNGLFRDPNFYLNNQKDKNYVVAKFKFQWEKTVYLDILTS
jgi:hypothetical protein